MIRTDTNLLGMALWLRKGFNWCIPCPGTRLDYYRVYVYTIYIYISQCNRADV